MFSQFPMPTPLAPVALPLCGSDHGSSRRAAGPGSEASEAAVPDQFMCSITAEIMTDPVNTVCRTLP